MLDDKISLSSQKNALYAQQLVDFKRDFSYTQKEQYLSATLGGAYKIIDWLSAALGMKFIYASLENEVKASNILFTANDQDWGVDQWETQINPMKAGIRSIPIFKNN